MDKDFRKAVLAELDRHGVKAKIVFGGKHQFVVFHANGQRRRYPIPLTPSDGRALKNCLAEIRRILGVKNTRPKSTRAKTHRPKQAEPLPALPEKVTPGPDWQRKLRELM